MGLAGLKKLLGLAAIIIPGVIGYFKICQPQHNNFLPEYNTGYHQYNNQGLGTANYHHHTSGPSPYYKSQGTSNYADPYTNYYRESGQAEENGGVRFGEDHNHAQNLAYQGYSEYRNKNVEGVE